MKNDYRDDDSWENEAVQKGGDRFFDEWFKEGDKWKHNSLGRGGSPLAGISIAVVIIFSLSLLMSNFEGCSIGSITMLNNNDYVTKTARVRIRNNYHLPWGDIVAVAKSLGFRGVVNMETGWYEFFYICDEARFEQRTTGTVLIESIKSDNRFQGYHLRGGPVEGRITNISSSEWGDLTLRIKIDFKVGENVIGYR